MLTFNFNNIASDTKEIKVLKINRPILPEIKDVYVDIPGRDNSILVSSTLADEIITVECLIYFNNDKQQKLDMLAQYLYTRERKDLIFSDVPNVIKSAKVESIQITKSNHKYCSFTITFRCAPKVVI